MEEINVYSEIITAVLAIITSLITVYRTNPSKTRKRLQEYHKKVLIPFMHEYKLTGSEQRDWCKFIDNMVTYEDDFVPPYIHYLVEKRNAEELEKVLVNDAYEYYENERNSFNFYFDAIINMIFKVLSVACIITVASAVLLIVFEFAIIVFSIITYGIGDFIYYIAWGKKGLTVLGYLICAIGSIGLYKLIYRFFLVDIYTCRLYDIRRIIVKKTKKIYDRVEQYDENSPIILKRWIDN